MSTEGRRWFDQQFLAWIPGRPAAEACTVVQRLDQHNLYMVTNGAQSGEVRLRQAITEAGEAVVQVLPNSGPVEQAKYIYNGYVYTWQGNKYLWRTNGESVGSTGALLPKYP